MTSHVSVYLTQRIQEAILTHFEIKGSKEESRRCYKEED